MGEVVVITSGKGGVGKTTATANIGTALAMMGKKVALVDTDIGLRKLDLVLGLENRIVFHLVDVTSGNCRLKQALIRDKRLDGLYFLPAAQTRDKTAVIPEQMQELCLELKREFDYVLIDCPAGIEQGFKNAVAGADQALVVTNPEISAVRDADRIIGLLESSEIKNSRLIVNRIRPQMVKRGNMLDVNDILDNLRIDLIGIVPVPRATADKASSAIWTGMPVSSLTRLSNPFSKEPPPAKTIPRSIMSAASSGGVLSRQILIPSTI
jgi:septum site-determining protein MinD